MKGKTSNQSDRVATVIKLGATYKDAITGFTGIATGEVRYITGLYVGGTL